MKIVINKHGFIEKLFFKNKNIILPWGIECGDSSSFFSLTENGWRVDKKYIKKIIKENSIKGNIQIKMSEGLLDLNYEDKFDSKKITRKAVIRALEDSYLMDFVIRYRFKKTFFKYALIDNKKIYHLNKNKYYQFPVENVYLVGDDISLKIELIKSSSGDNFLPFMYVRDFKNEWIIHCRLFPINGDKNIIKLNTSWYNKALPQKISNLLLRNSFFKKIIWYRQERKPYKRWNFLFKYILKPCGYYLVKLSKNESLEINSQINFKIVQNDQKR